MKKRICRNAKPIPKELLKQLILKCSESPYNQNTLSVNIGINSTTLNHILTGKGKRIQQKTLTQIEDFLKQS